MLKAFGDSKTIDDFRGTRMSIPKSISIYYHHSYHSLLQSKRYLYTLRLVRLIAYMKNYDQEVSIIVLF